jgi:aminotransferase in exopolysaccharide biosynthesis
MTPNTEIFEKIIRFIRETFRAENEFIPLHEPKFRGNDKEYVARCIDSTFVSSVGEFVDKIESEISKYTGAKHAVAVVNGTSALYVALGLAGVEEDDEVLTQALTFVATSNTIKYRGAFPLYIDVDRETLGLSPARLEDFLSTKAHVKRDGFCYNRQTGRRISACVPVHVYGHPCDVVALKAICDKHNITLVEDAAESIGSLLDNRHAGTFGKLGTLSFNGNKIITCGGGGMILTDDEQLARTAKHLTTQAKTPHPWFFIHDHVAYNFRMPNLNAALACAQLEQLDGFIQNKRELAGLYDDFFKTLGIQFVKEPPRSRSNYWLNAILLKNMEERNAFLKYTNENGVMTRPAWELMPALDMFKDCYRDSLDNSQYIFERLVNIPSSVRS